MSFTVDPSGLFYRTDVVLDNGHIENPLSSSMQNVQKILDSRFLLNCCIYDGNKPATGGFLRRDDINYISIRRLLIMLVEKNITTPTCLFDGNHMITLTVGQEPVSHITVTNNDIDCTKKLHQLLDTINVPLYFSKGNQIFYTREELLKIFEPELKIFDFELNDHCNVVNIHNLHIGVLNSEIEELFNFVNHRQHMTSLRQRMNFVKSKLKFREDVDPSLCLESLIGY
jgi:hypothetical protein